MTRYHYLRARNKNKLPFESMSALQQRLLCDNGDYTEIFCPQDGTWLLCTRLVSRCTPAYFLSNAIYRLSSDCKPPNFKETT